MRRVVSYYLLPCPIIARRFKWERREKGRESEIEGRKGGEEGK